MADYCADNENRFYNLWNRSAYGLTEEDFKIELIHNLAVIADKLTMIADKMTEEEDDKGE